jgi:putative flippase GtrA
VFGQLAVFGAIGAVSTMAYAALFVLLSGVAPAQVANLVALVGTAVANTAANRRLTFGIRDRLGAGRAHLQGLLVFALGLALTSGSLALLHASAPRPPRAVELGVLLAASAVGTVVRFVLLRTWVFRAGAAGAPRTDQPATPPAAGGAVLAPARLAA